MNQFWFCSLYLYKFELKINNALTTLLIATETKTFIDFIYIYKGIILDSLNERKGNYLYYI